MTVDPKTGKLTTVKIMDRESSYVKNDSYTVVIHAIDDGRHQTNNYIFFLLNVQNLCQILAKQMKPHTTHFYSLLNTLFNQKSSFSNVHKKFVRMLFFHFMNSSIADLAQCTVHRTATRHRYMHRNNLPG